MRVGILGARGDRRGLAAQTADLARHLGAAAVLGVDMGGLSPYPNDWGDYDPATLTVLGIDAFDEQLVSGWLRNVDVIVGAETFYRPWVVPMARALGVGTVLQYNHEFLWTQQEWGLSDVMGNPSTWHLDETPGARYLPLGVDPARFPFRQRTEATFLHVVGHMAMHDRNGTRIVFDALRMVQEPIRIVIRSQRGLTAPRRFARHVELEVVASDLPDRRALYETGNVLLLPRRYGGNSLVMQEALSLGMPVLMSDAEPQRRFLPEGMLIPTFTDRQFEAQGGRMDLHDANPADLAARMDELVRQPDKVADLSLQAGRIAETFSWPTVLPLWHQALSDAVGIARDRTVQHVWNAPIPRLS